MALIGLDGIQDGVAPVLRQVEIRLTAAQVRGLSATEIEILPAPGAGKLHMIAEPGLIGILAAGTAFAGVSSSGEDISLQYTGSSTAMVTLSVSGFLDAATAEIRRAVPPGSRTFEPLANTAIEITAGGAFTAGRALRLRLYYCTIDVS